jgi:hypothetical protein
MRFDGHVKITLQALDILTTLSQRTDVPWAAPTATVGEESTPWGHRLGVLGYLKSPFAGLPELVAGVSDITNAQSHFMQDMQRLHFMRATDETELAAYWNAVNFIVGEMDAWIRARTEGFLEMVARSAKRSALFNVPALEKGMRVDAPLARALHCLQDSFSPGHVLRSEVDGNRMLGTARKHASPACFASAPPIRGIFDYNHPHDEADVEARQQHDESDYYAGSLVHAAANAAAYASADLIRIGLDAIAKRQSSGTAWSQFTSRWLAQRLPHDAPKKLPRVADIDALLQRSCSPSKMACGRCPD